MPLNKLSKEELIALVQEKDHDIETLGNGIIGALKAVGVKDFENLDNVSSQILRGLPTVMSSAMIMPKLLAKKFEIVTVAFPLLDKYKHLIKV